MSTKIELYKSYNLSTNQGKFKVTSQSKSIYEGEISEAEEYLSNSIGEKIKNYGYWRVIAYPINYNESRMNDHQSLKAKLEQSKVSLRGWDFPHIDSKNISNFNKGRQSFTVWEKYVEGFRIYKDGLFIWKSALWEDTKEYKGTNDCPILVYSSAIYTITEMFLFIKRFYEEIALDTDIHLEIILNNTNNRQLNEIDPRIGIRENCISKEPEIRIEKNIKVVELKIGYLEIANSITRELFAIFNFEDVKKETIEQWQKKLVERDFS